MPKKNRKYYRTDFVFPVRITLQEEPENSFHAFSDNISEGGLKLTLSRCLKKNTEVLLRFDLMIDKGSFTQVFTSGKILWQKKHPNRKWEHGISFANLSKENWQAIKIFMKKYCVE